MKYPLGLLAALLYSTVAAHAALAQDPAAEPASGALAWPPTLDARNATPQAVDGRTIERFVHGNHEPWGYPPGKPGEWDYPPPQESALQQNHNSFYVVSPKEAHEGMPMCVVLHSANRTGFDYLGYAALNRKVDPGDDPASGLSSAPADFYGLFLNSTNDEWWGWHQAQGSEDFAKHVNSPAPAERRVMETIDWVASRYHVDRNRIYLCGVSMGGGGGLAIGLAHGEVFAAMRFCVPADTHYAAYRTNDFNFQPPLADPPVLVDFSSQVDTWSSSQPALVGAAMSRRFPLVLCWGPFGHTGGGNRMVPWPICQVAIAFPWLEVRKNEAYPVFSGATCDQISPWLSVPAPEKFDEAGQYNAYFRWKTARDAAADFAMQLWIAHPAVTVPVPSMPEAAAADISFRRLQQFKIEPGASYAWKLSREGKTVDSGTAMPDAAGLLTIPRVSLTTAVSELALEKNSQP